MKIFTQKDTSVYIQFQYGKQLFYLGECVDLDSIPNPRLGGIDLIQCRNRSGRGFKTLGKKYTPPGNIEVTLTEMSSDAISWLERVQCPFNLYALQRTCGDAGVPGNWVKGAIVEQMEITQDNLNQLAHHLDENENQHEWTLVGIPPRVDVREVTASKEAVTETENALCLDNCAVLYCDDDCGAYTLPSDNWYVGTALDGAATSNVQHSHDGGTTWAATAADPFAISESIISIACFEIGAGVSRQFAVRSASAPAGTALEGAYSDDDGATWTVVTIGSTVNEAATGPKCLCVIDQYHLWLGTDAGNIYFSSDGGVTWAVQGTSTGAADVNFIDFADEDNGIAGCDGDVIMLTIDGGVHWTAGTATGSGADLLSGHCFNANRFIVGTSSVAGLSLYQTWNGSTTWTRVNFTGYLLERVQDMDFWNDSCGFMITNTAGPVGSLHRTIDGGYSWKEITIPANLGLNAIKLCGLNEGIYVGEVDAGGNAHIVSFG